MFRTVNVMSEKFTVVSHNEIMKAKINVPMRATLLNNSMCILLKPLQSSSSLPLEKQRKLDRGRKLKSSKPWSRKRFCKIIFYILYGKSRDFEN